MQTNAFGYYLYDEPEKLFGINHSRPRPNKFRIDKAKSNLARYKYNEPNQEKVFKEKLPIPDLLADNIFDHFEKMSEELLGKEIDMIDSFAETPFTWTKREVIEGINNITLELEAGWQVYCKKQKHWKKIKNPPENSVIIYDTETFVLGGNYPIIGVAMNHNYLYLWLPENLDPNKKLIPLGNKKVIIGHNIGFDLGKTREPFTLEEHSQYWLDTQSMHIIVGGLASGQRWYTALKESAYKDKLTEAQRRRFKFKPKWGDQGTTNSLVATYNYHVVEDEDWFNEDCKRLEEADKELRDVFVKGTLKSIQDGIRDGKLLEYAVLDVFYTFKLFLKLYPKFRYHKPAKTSLAGMMLRMDGRIPLSPKWTEWIEGCEKIYAEHLEEVGKFVRDTAKKVYAEYLKNPSFWKDDPWLNQLNWNVKTKKGKYAGMPDWYRPFHKDPDIVYTTKAVITHLFLRLTWEDSVLIKTKQMGWVYREHGKLKKVPHYKEDGANVGELITKNYLYAIDAGILKATGSEESKRIFQIAKATSFWRGVRSRVMGKIVINENDNLITVAEPLPYGTITGRVVEKLMLTLCSTKPDRIGTELKTRIEAPKGYEISGFDFDGQEMHIAALLADKYAAGVPGATPISFQVLTGNKADKTDSHSALAKYLEVERDDAKPLNFLCAYSGGKKALSEKLQLNHREWTKDFCDALAEKTLSLKKGLKKGNYYFNGTDSDLFNYMEDLVTQKRPRLAALNTLISRALWSEYCDTIHAETGRQIKEFYTGRANWLIQGCAAEMLDASLVAIKWLGRKYEILFRYILSIHDDLRYLTKPEQRKKCAMIYQIAHIWAWSLLHYGLDMCEMPLAGAFLSGVEFDYRLRKSPKEKTSSISHDGSQEPEGITLTIEDLIGVTL